MINYNCCWILLFVAIASAKSYHTRNLQSTDCCSNCLSQPDKKGIDALDFDKCGSATDGSGCCFESECNQSNFGVFTLGGSSTTTKDGVPEVIVGELIRLEWENVEEVTYVNVNDGASKNTQPKKNSNAADVTTDGIFTICAQNIGDIYLRGWSDSFCEASIEYHIAVIAGEDGETSAASCASSSTITEIPNTSFSGECNLNRASIIDGECVCASDWAGPPSCNGLPVWKWILTSMGAVAAIVSIFVGVHAYLGRRKKLKAESTAMANNEVASSPNQDNAPSSTPQTIIPYNTAPREYEL